MDNKIITGFYDYEVVRKVRTGYLVRLFFDAKGRNTDVFYLSEKQFKKLRESYDKIANSRVKNTYGLVVIDGDRFVWCGVEYPDYSDREYLMKHFSAVFTPTYEKVEVEKTVHVPDKIEPTDTPPNEDLIRASE